MRERLRHAWEREYALKGHIYGRLTQDLPIPIAGERILDVGCGDCRTFRSLVPDCKGGFSGCLVGVDHSRSALSLCRAPVSQVPNLHVLCADATVMPFPDESFDTVLLIHVLGHVLQKDRKRVAREAARVVTRGGVVFVRVFSLSDFRAGEGTEIEEGTRLRKTGICTHYFTPEEICDLFSFLDPVSLKVVTWTMGSGKRSARREEIQVFFRAGERK